MVAGALGGPLPAYPQPVTYDFTGEGRVWTFTGVGYEYTSLETTFTGSVRFDVLSDGPGGADSGTDGATWAQDRDGWVHSDFTIRWTGHSFNPAPGDGLVYSDAQVSR